MHRPCLILSLVKSTQVYKSPESRTRTAHHDAERGLVAHTVLILGLATLDQKWEGTEAVLTVAMSVLASIQLITEEDRRPSHRCGGNHAIVMRSKATLSCTTSRAKRHHMAGGKKGEKKTCSYRLVNLHN